jgi:DNA invertase Pin-like site-specific DNA recombinase
MKHQKTKEGTKMRKPKKVIAYVCDIPIPGTDEVISKNDQKARILKFAEKEGIEVVNFYEDEKFTENFMERPGVQRVLACNENVDQVMVERVWCFTRSPRELDALMGELDKKGVPLAATSYLWDCLSQQVRHRYMGSTAEKARQLLKQTQHVAAA